MNILDLIETVVAFLVALAAIVIIISHGFDSREKPVKNDYPIRVVPSFEPGEIKKET